MLSSLFFASILLRTTRDNRNRTIVHLEGFPHVIGAFVPEYGARFRQFRSGLAFLKTRVCARDIQS